MAKAKDTKHKAKEPPAKPERKAKPFEPPYTEKEAQVERIVDRPNGKEMEKKKTPAISWVNNESQCVPKSRATCGNCEHGPETHYGSEADWCNLKKCRCQGWANE